MRLTAVHGAIPCTKNIFSASLVRPESPRFGGGIASTVMTTSKLVAAANVRLSLGVCNGGVGDCAGTADNEMMTGCTSVMGE